MKNINLSNIATYPKNCEKILEFSFEQNVGIFEITLVNGENVGSEKYNINVYYGTNRGEYREIYDEEFFDLSMNSDNFNILYCAKKNECYFYSVRLNPISKVYVKMHMNKFVAVIDYLSKKRLAYEICDLIASYMTHKVITIERNYLGECSHEYSVCLCDYYHINLWNVILNVMAKMGKDEIKDNLVKLTSPETDYVIKSILNWDMNNAF